MSDISRAGRIPEPAFRVGWSLNAQFDPAADRFQGCLGAFLGLSVLAVAARTVIRIKSRHSLYADDAFLFFGLICMCIATGLAYVVLPLSYLQEAVFIDPEQHKLTYDVLPALERDQKLTNMFFLFSWTAEFAVKLSLLFFFRQLVQRLPRLTLYVKSVMVVTTVVWVVLICEPWILCPHTRLLAICMSKM